MSSLSPLPGQHLCFRILSASRILRLYAVCFFPLHGGDDICICCIKWLVACLVVLSNPQMAPVFPVDRSSMLLPANITCPIGLASINSFVRVWAFVVVDALFFLRWWNKKYISKYLAKVSFFFSQMMKWKIHFKIFGKSLILLCNSTVSLHSETTFLLLSTTWTCDDSQITC